MFYHVRITPRGGQSPRQGVIVLDKDADWIEEHIAAPRRQGQDIFVGGRVLSWPDVERIRIFQTDEALAHLRPEYDLLRGPRDRFSEASDEWFALMGGRDVTEQFLTGLPGGAPRAGAGQALTYAANRKAVMVIYGHDEEANGALFDWLRSIGLQPLEWNQLVNASGDASPFIGQVLEQALKQVQAVVAFFTPDERVLSVTGPRDAWRLQARPNVLFEAGMAFAAHPRRTVLAVLGDQELPSDLAGRHYVRLSHTDHKPLQDLATRLHQAGCDTDTSGTDWLRPGRFPGRDHVPRAHRASSSAAPGGGAAQAQERPENPAGNGPSLAATRRYRLARVLTGHDAVVYAVEFSPDGARLATAGQDETVRLWDPATGEWVHILAGHSGPVSGVAFSPDSALLATASGSAGKGAKLWNPATGECVCTLTGHSGPVFGVAFSPDGALLATAGGDHTARIWDLATVGCVRTLSGHSENVRGVAFSPDGGLLATASEDSTARLWDPAAGGCVRRLTSHGGPVNGVAFSPDGGLLATASEDSKARLWDPATGVFVRSLTSASEPMYGLAFSPDGALLATTGRDGNARIWNVATRECVQSLIGHMGPVWAAAFSQDGTMLATVGSDGTARIWAK